MVKRVWCFPCALTTKSIKVVRERKQTKFRSAEREKHQATVFWKKIRESGYYNTQRWWWSKTVKLF